SPGTPLLGLCALLWNVFGLIAHLLILAGFSARDVWVGLAHAVCLSGGAMFPISFLQLWSRPASPGSVFSLVTVWLVRAAKFNAAWIVVLLFACPFSLNPQPIMYLSNHVVAWNASFLLTTGALVLVRGRLRVTADRIYLALTLVGAWGSTLSI